ncbi:MAG: TonB-dependent receptor [Prolixibacteraceae bacterium]
MRLLTTIQFISFPKMHRWIPRLLLFILFTISLGNLSAQYSLKGIVKNPEGEVLAGATVQIADLNKIAATDSEGSFNFNGLQKSDCSLIITFIGYRSYQVKLALKQGVNKLNFTLVNAEIMTEDVIVSATRAGNRTPMAYTNLEVSSLPGKHTGQDLPYLLSLTPSLVATSDAGTGIGYTNFRIRGSDANRINMTVNGIPLNDAESHSVYFVDLPDFAASTGNIQVQRGVGSSTNGAGAFGGTVNVQTSNLNQKSYAGWSIAAGSFGTLKNTVTVGSGLLNGKFVVEARLSKINSDGYVDRAASDLHSFYLSAGYFTEKTLLKAIFFSGKEKTYQAWNGVPSSMLKTNRTYNPSGIIYGTNGEISFYDNETDNYQQDHYQLHYTHQFLNHFSANFSLHYTYGRGYYEEYRQNQNLADYRMNPTVAGDSTLSETDLVRRKWLDNDFYGAVASISYKEDKTELIIGSAWNNYAGDNFGNVIWAGNYGNNAINHEWYRSKGDKNDFNFFAKLNFQLSDKLSFYADVQYRHINYRITGIDDNLRDLTQSHQFDFVNPKLGFFYTFNDHQNIYLSYGNAHREPNRSNYTDADPTKPAPIQEKLHDFELGYKGGSEPYNYGINLYGMIYLDQLILTGQINDVGSAIMTNVPKSHRIGIEYSGKLRLLKNLFWEHHATLSRNKIIGFVEYVDDWDQWGSQVAHDLGTTDIAYSPSLTAGSNLCWKASNAMNVNFQSTYVSRQYLDNTSNTDRSLNAYFVSNLKFDFTLAQKMTKKWSFFASINNLFNERYESNGWVYSYYSDGSRKKEDGLFPQAGISYLLGMSIEF